MRQINDDKTVYTRDETQMDGKYRTIEPVFRGGYMTAAILAETEDHKVNFITSQGEVVYTEKEKER